MFQGCYNFELLFELLFKSFCALSFMLELVYCFGPSLAHIGILFYGAMAR